MQELNPPEGIKTGSTLTVRMIFENNHNWDVYHYHNREKMREVEFSEVQKMMSCKDLYR